MHSLPTSALLHNVNWYSGDLRSRIHKECQERLPFIRWARTS